MENMSPLSPRTRTSARRRVRALAALTAAAALTLSACSSGQDSASPAAEDEGPAGQDVAEGVNLMGQWPLTSVTAFVRSADPAGRAQDVHALMREVDPMVAISELKTMSQIVDDELASSRIINGLFAGFALLALALAAAGLFGVISYSVGQRRRELGIRLALGASPAGIGRMIVGEGLKIVGIGMAVGLLLAIALARASSSLLFGITAADPATFGGVAALILVVTLLAAWAPASRAMRVDPAGTLRAE